VVACLALPAAAFAHGTVTPAFLASGEQATVTVDAPNERPSQPMTRLVVVLPEGLSAAPEGQPETRGWRLRTEGRRVSWSGGSVPPDAPAAFALRLRADGDARTLTVGIEQHYPDGGVVSWQPAFTVLPATGSSPGQHPGRALVAAGVGLVVIGASLVLGRRLRRGSLQRE
jgi:uncharacterized protein YcnI